MTITITSSSSFIEAGSTSSEGVGGSQQMDITPLPTITSSGLTTQQR